MFCKYCGKEVPDDAEYCVECGKRLSAYTPSVDAISDSTPDFKQQQNNTTKQQSVDKLLVTQIILGAVTFALLTLARLFIFVTGSGVVVMSAYSIFVGIAFLIIGIVRFVKNIRRTQHKTAEAILFSLTITLFVYTMIAFIVVVSVF